MIYNLLESVSSFKNYQGGGGHPHPHHVKLSLIYKSVYKLLSGDCLVFRVFNDLFELDSRYLRESVSTVKPSQEGESFCMVIKYSRLLLLSICQNTSESIRPCFRKKSDMGQQP